MEDLVRAATGIREEIVSAGRDAGFATNARLVATAGSHNEVGLAGLASSIEPLVDEPLVD